MFLVRLDPDPPINKQKNKKNNDFCWLGTFNDSLSLMTDVNVRTESNKQNKLQKKLIFGWHLETYRRKEMDPDP